MEDRDRKGFYQEKPHSRDKLSFDVSEAADLLKTSPDRVMDLAREGTIVAAKIGASWVFPVDDLVDYLKQEAQRQTARRRSHKPPSTGQAVGNTITEPERPRRRGRIRKALPALPAV